MQREFSLEGREYVELKSLLKLLDYVNSGGEAKMMVLDGQVQVNDEVELRRGKKLRPDDIIKVKGDEIKILS